MNRIITIGREFGSGGRELGRRLAEKLDIAYYDSEIVKALVERTPFTEEYIRRVEEQKPTPLFPITIGRTFTRPFNPVSDHGQTVVNEQSRIIREMAEKSACVIVGRCADYLLRDLKPIRLFVYADMSHKMARCREKGEVPDGMTDKALRQQILAIDKRRAGYYHFYTDQTWGDKAHYDLCLNTTSLSIKEAVNAIASFAEGCCGQMHHG